MKRLKITNNSDIKLEFFVKRDNSEDTLVSLEPGATCFSDGEELTRSLKIFNRKGFLDIKLGDFSIVHGFSDTIVANVDPNKDEVLDNLHTTKDIRSADIENIKDIITFEGDFSSIKKDLSKYHNIGEDEFENLKKEISETIINEKTSIVDLLKSQAQQLIELEEYNKTNDTSNNIEGAIFDTTTQTNMLETAERQAKEYKEESEKKQYKYKYKKKPGRKKKRGPKTGSKKKKSQDNDNTDNLDENTEN